MINTSSIGWIVQCHLSHLMVFSLSYKVCDIRITVPSVFQFTFPCIPFSILFWSLCFRHVFHAQHIVGFFCWAKMNICFYLSGFFSSYLNRWIWICKHMTDICNLNSLIILYNYIYFVVFIYVDISSVPLICKPSSGTLITEI